MTNNQLTREKVQWLHDAAEEAAAVGIKLTMNPKELLMFTSALLAAMDSEPVMYCMEGNGLDPEAVSTRREVVEAWVNEWNTEDRSPGEPIYSTVPLYRHAQPAPVVLENCVTAEHRRVIEMLLNVCGAAFELADDSCQQDVDGEDCHVVPNSAFQKLSDMLDEIENSLPTEDADRPDVFLAWSAMPRASLKSLLQAGNSPLWVGVDWAKGCEPGNSPVIPDGYVMVPKEPTEDMIAAAMNCDDVLFNSDESFCVQFGNIYEAMLAAAPQEDE
ncbi:hypothetical protein [Raoultella planticola]|uniref:hypothetical protein n=1 Tax=Raoultella planticola TaxID=575 RepID=UPI0025AA46E8|nr:hypothetical protein [Raoultella planticola]MDM9668916.1 hypothetical protein [Raoultella planticola]